MINLRSSLAVCLLSLLCLNLAQAQGPEVKQLPSKSIAKLSGFPDGVVSTAYSPDGKYLAAGTYQELHLFETEGYKLVKKVAIPAGDVRALAFHPAKPQLAVGYYQDWAVYSIPDLEPTVLPGLPIGNVTGVAYSSDGKLLSGSTEGEKIHLVSTDDNKLIRSLTGHAYPIQGVAFSPDGTLLASVAGDENRATRPGEVKLWSVATGEEIAKLVEHEKAAFSAVFSPDGKFLVTTSLDSKCNVYDVATQKPVGFFDGHGRPTNAAVFAAGSQVVISGAGGRAKGKNDVILWLTESGDELGKISAHEQPIKALALHPDGKTLAVGSEDQTVSIWNITGPLSAVAASAKTVAAQPAPEKEKEVFKIGIIGLDTSHVIAFTKAINAEEPKPEFKGFRIVAAYPQGSPDIESSTTRVPGYTKQVQDMGVEIVDSIEELAQRVDAVLLETNDGRPHLEQLIPCLKAGKPVFIDKPVAGSLVDAIAIYEAAKKFNVPVFSSSSLRYTQGAQ
ncbi:MAG TPA: Gfo/Idh/MocA family oxidoreductase, partial [Planctomycetaceae bacterium]|nr:Gfo/Idh/MocA family oxidoreductase [Planctomycetaceae bacterium]